MKNNKLSKAISLGLLSAGSFTPSYADAENSESSFALEEVVVTARKREESLQDAPISITAFSSADIEARDLDSINEITQSTPNLVFDAGRSFSGSSANAFVYIRGIGQQDFTFNADPGVGTYVDGVYLSRSMGGIVNLLDIERVEVLRGPQGTLFGKNTTGGAVNITSKRPADEFEGKIGARIGRFNRRDIYGSVHIPITEDLKTLTSFSSRKRDGYVDNLTTGVESSDVDSMSFRSLVDWQVADNINLLVSVDATKERQNKFQPVAIGGINPAAEPFAAAFNGAVPGGVCFAPGASSNPSCFNSQFVQNTDEFSTTAGLEPSSSLDVWGLSAILEWDINDDLTFKSISAIREFDSDAGVDIDQSPLPVFDVDLDQEMTAISQEFQILGNALDERLDWIVGVFYLDEDGEHLENITQALAQNLTSGGDTINESIAAFAQGTYQLTNRLSMTLGLRYTDESREYTPEANIYGPGGVQVGSILPSDTVKQTVYETTPMVNLAYAWTDEINTYISYSEGFKSGGFAQRLTTPNSPRVPSFDPEFVETTEVGIKMTALDNRLRLNAAVFHTDFTDIQVQGNIPGIVGTATTNAGEAEIDGFEVEFTYLPLAGLLIQGGVGYLDADFTKLDNAVVGITLDSELPKTPQWTSNASISYEFVLADGHTITPRVDWSFRSTVVNELGANDDALDQGSYSLYNASIAFETADGDWKAVLSGKNLGDEIYLVDAGDTTPVGTAYGVYGLPRTWTLSLERRF